MHLMPQYRNMQCTSCPSTESQLWADSILLWGCIYQCGHDSKKPPRGGSSASQKVFIIIIDQKVHESDSWQLIKNSPCLCLVGYTQLNFDLEIIRNLSLLTCGCHTSSVFPLQWCDRQGQKVLIIKLLPEDFNWIPLIYTQYLQFRWSWLSGIQLIKVLRKQLYAGYSISLVNHWVSFRIFRRDA